MSGPAGLEERACRVGITGHLNLTPRTTRLVMRALRRHLREIRDRECRDASVIVGVSCLAPGADSVFAKVLLSLGGRLEVVLPSTDYGSCEAASGHSVVIDDLVRRAADVKVMPFPSAKPPAFVAANNAMLDTVDRLVAVWDGRPADTEGGTYHVVKTARARNIPVTVVWPHGAKRT